MNKKIVWNRAIAYLIDFFIIYILSYALSNSKVNPQYDSYLEAYDSYSTSFGTYSNVLASLNEYFEDEEISEEEAEKFSSKYGEYQEFFTKYYDDKVITEDELEDMTTDIINDYFKVYRQHYYNLEKYSTISNGVYIVIILLYFGLFPLFTEGYTLGKKVMKLRIVKKDGKKATLINYALRAIILYGLLFTLMDIFMVTLLSVKKFYLYSYSLTIAKSIVEWIIIIMVLIRKDNRGLHDLIGGTKVINSAITQEVVNDEYVIEEKQKPEYIEVIPKKEKTAKIKAKKEKGSTVK